MKSLVSVGMDIDKASAILRANGFEPQPKYFPTNAKDYYWVDVRLIHRRSIILDISRFFGGDVVYFSYGCLEAGLDNKVREVM